MSKGVRVDLLRTEVRLANLEQRRTQEGNVKDIQRRVLANLMAWQRAPRSGGHPRHPGVYAHGRGPRAAPAERLRAAGGLPGDPGGGHGPGAQRRGGTGRPLAADLLARGVWRAGRL
ncbi:MAG: hypothetical protein MZV70_30045 [Desulfobacterales bacterium]|nr:hypothetical protein [Desulfobacterales bacterium]